MKIRNLISILSITVLISACTFITDPLSISLKDVKMAREGAATMKSPLEVDAVRNNIKATASVKKWTIFRDQPEDKCFVIMNLPGFINTTEVGIFIEPQEEGGCIIEVASLNPKAQKFIADDLFKILKLL